MASNSLDAVFPRDHVFYQIQDGSPDHQVIQSHPFFPRWYYSWFATFSRMFPDHLDDCRLEMASAVGKRTINGSLIQAMGERWNPRSCTFWFSWGEMTLLMDEFNDIMGLLKPAGQPDDPVEQQFLINIKGVDVQEVFGQSNREQLLTSHRDRLESVHWPVRTLSQVQSLRRGWHFVLNNKRQNSACHDPMHSGISFLSKMVRIS